MLLAATAASGQLVEDQGSPAGPLPVRDEDDSVGASLEAEVEGIHAMPSILTLLVTSQGHGLPHRTHSPFWLRCSSSSMRALVAAVLSPCELADRRGSGGLGLVGVEALLRTHGCGVRSAVVISLSE